MILESVNGSDIFAQSIQSSAGLESLSNGALEKGIDLYLSGNYKAAVKEFQRSMGLAPTSANSVDAANYMAEAYLKLDNTEKAIRAYKSSLELNPFVEDTHKKLGNLYFSLERYEESEKEYKEVLELNSNGVNYYALGQVYLATGRYDEAENVFSEVRRLEPEKAEGYFGLGLARTGQERHEEAIAQFEEALVRDSSLLEAHAEIGYIYADLGEMDMARSKLDYLSQQGSFLADALDRYMYRVDPPKIMFASAFDSTFHYMLPIKTAVSSMDSYLTNANAEKKFTMVFQFDKQMDRTSVENRVNWQISRSTQNGPGQAYNFGLPIPSTEISVSSLPVNVYWNDIDMTATVTFRLQQNATADGTIDPSHIEFKFSGKDIYGNSMDENFDQFMGFSGIA